MEDIEYRNILIVLHKRIWIILLSTVLLVAITGYISYFLLEPEYKSTATLLIGKKQGRCTKIEYSDILLNQNLVNTYGEIIKSRFVIGEVTRNLGINQNYEDFMKNIKVTFNQEAQLIVIEVRNNDPVFAAKIANEIATVFIKNIKQLMNVNNVQLVDKPEVSKKPSSPYPLLNMTIVCILGLTVGIFIALVLEQIKSTSKSKKEIEEYLHLSVIGMIPKMKGLKSWTGKDKNIIYDDGNPSFQCEAYKAFRANIQFAIIHQHLKSILVTSPEMGDGKSTIISNLAINISRDGYRVLLIDANLRKPKIHELFGISNYIGISNVLMEEIQYKEAVHNISEKYPEILTSGPVLHNLSKLFPADKMKVLLEKVKKEYDLVLIDSPSAGLVSDAVALSGIADGVILVCTYEESKVELLRNLKMALANVNVNIVGVVLNKFTKTLDYYKT